MPEIKTFDDDTGGEFKIGAALTPGSVWVLRKPKWLTRTRRDEHYDFYSRPEPEADLLEAGTIVMVLRYSSKLHDHLLTVLSGRHMYSTCISRGDLRGWIGLLCEATQDYDLDLDI